MKHLIILPGNNPTNKSWGERMLSHYAEHFDSLYLQEYDHWQTGEQNFSFVTEEEKLRTHAETLPKDTSIFLLAKSAGAVLAFGAVQAEIIHPTHCAFFGIPFEWAITDVFTGNWSVVDTFSVPAVAFHNRNDPTAPFAYTKSVIELRLPEVTLVTTESSDHLYDDLDLYDQYLLPIFKR